MGSLFEFDSRMFGVEVSQSSVGFVTVGDYCSDVVDVPYVDGQLRFEVPVNESMTECQFSHD